MFTKFEDIFAELAGRGAKKRMIAAWGVDGHTIAAASKAIDLGMIEATLVGDEAHRHIEIHHSAQSVRTSCSGGSRDDGA